MTTDIVIRSRKFLTNKLLDRKQFIIDVYHSEAGDVSKKAIKKVIGKKFKVSDEVIVLFGFRTKFGGGKSTGFCLIYNSLDSLKKFEPKHRQIRLGHMVKDPKKKSRGMKKEHKNRVKNMRGKAKVTGEKKKKKKK